MQSPWDVVNESPYFSDWFSGLYELSPDVELELHQSLQSLRMTSKKLIKNNFIASAAQLAYINTIMGGKLEFDVSGVSESFRQDVLRTIAENIYGMDINRQYSISQIVEQIITAAFQDGDVLILLPRDGRSKRKIKTYVELVEAARIKTPPRHKTNTLVKEGVEYYSSGRLKGYWVIKRKTQEQKVTYYTANDADFEFFPAYKKDGKVTRRVAWLFKSPLNLRPGQSRALPVLTGAMGLLRYFMQYLEAVLVGSRVAACYSAFVKTANPADARKSLSESNDTVGTKGKKLTKLKPGTIAYLRTNEDISFASPNRPSDNFDTFVLRLSKFTAMTIRVPYEQMYLDLAQTNYSSWRGGSLETERNINRWKRDLEDCVRWIIFTYLQEALVTRQLKGSLKGMTLKVTFPVYKTLDEEKTARARRLDLQTESTSQHRIQAGIGQSYEELQGELDDEALRAVERQAKILKRQKELSEKYDILFPDQVQVDGSDEDTQTDEDRDTSGSRREGEEEGSDLDEEDARERRREDGNW